MGYGEDAEWLSLGERLFPRFLRFFTVINFIFSCEFFIFLQNPKEILKCGSFLVVQKK